MVTAGMLLGGAGVAAAHSGSYSPATTTSPASSTPSPTPTTPATTTTATTTAATTTTATTSTTATTTSPTSTTSTTTSPTSTTETTAPATSTTTTSSSPTTTPPVSQGEATAQVGCLGEVSIVVSGTELAEGTVVDIQVTDGVTAVTDQASVIGGRIAFLTSVEAVAGVPSLGVLVQVPGSDAVYVYTVPVQHLTDVCTAEGGISLARDCATPDTVLATIQAQGLTAGGTYGISVIGTSPSGADVLLASADVVSVDGTLAGTLPLASITGTVPLDGFTGVALLIDGQVFASVGATEVVVGTCVVPQPLPVAPVPPITTPPVTTTPAPAVPVSAHPAQPAALASTGAEPAGLLLLAGLFLGLGGLTTFVARRTAR